jgi:regulatory protein
LNPSLKARALRCLAQREHSRAELARKLAQMLAREAWRQQAGVDGASASGRCSVDEDAGAERAADTRKRIEAVLDELQAGGWLSDERTAEAVRHGHSSRYGRHRLKQTLQAKGLEAELVAATLQRAQGSELARALEVWQRRWGRPPADAAEQARQQRFLAARGFDGDVIRQVLRQAGQGHTDEDADVDDRAAPRIGDGF